MRLFTLVLALLVSSCAISETPPADRFVRWEAPKFEENGDKIVEGSLIKYEIYAVELDAKNKVSYRLLDTVGAEKKEWHIPAEYSSIKIAMKVEGTTGTSEYSEARTFN